MKLNRKGTKVLLDGNTRLLGATGFALQFGIPFAYIATTYDLFTFENSRYAVTGWGMVGVAIAGFAFRNRIKTFITQYNTLGETAQRAKWGHRFLTVCIILAISSIFINAFLWFFGTLAFSNYVSLIPYTKYDVQVKEQKEMNNLLKEQNTKTTLQKLQELKQQKTTQV
jgi:hypothetical protein